jgi:hypothetical protein
MKDVHEYCSQQISKSNEYYAKYYNAKHRLPPKYVIGDKVLLSLENLKTIRPSKKLDQKRAGPFEVLEQIGNNAYRIKLPDSWKQHNVFHVSLLEPWDPPIIPNRVQPPPPPVEVEGIPDTKSEMSYLRNG